MGRRARTVLCLGLLCGAALVPVHGEPLDYWESFELGKRQARVLHKSWTWYLLGIPGTLAGAFFVGRLQSGISVPGADVPRPNRYLPGLELEFPEPGGGLLLGAAAYSRPHPPCVPSEDIVDPKGFCAGYLYEARRMNVRSVRWGKVTGQPLALFLFFSVVVQ